MSAANNGIIRWGTLLFLATGLAACSGGGSSPANINDDGFKRHGELRVDLGDAKVREGDSIAVSANLVGGTGFDPARVQWSVVPSQAGTVRNGYFVASYYGDATLQASFSGTQASGEAKILPAPRALAPVGADFRAGTAGLRLPDSVEVRVTGRDGVPVPEFDVQFQVAQGGGEISTSTARTDDQGRVRVAWTLGEAAGRNELKALIPGVGEARVEAEGYADLSSAEVDLLNGDAQQGQVGEVLPQPLAVRVNDVNGNPIRGITVEWIFDGDGSETGLFNTPPTDRTVVRSVTDAGGVSRMHWRLGTTAGDQLGSAIMIASSAAPGNGNGNGNGGGKDKTEFNAKARPGHLETIAITPDQAEIEVDGSTTLTATATDKWGNVIEVPLEWAVSDADIATVAEGVVHGDFPGLVSVSASSGSTSDQAEVTVLTGAPSALQATGSGQSAVTGQLLSQPLVATVTDEHGAAIEGVTVAWSVVSGGGSLSSQTTKTDAEGRASVEWTLGGSVGEQEVQAGVQTLEPVTYQATATEPTVASITVSPTSLSFVVGGGSQSLTATARDASGTAITAPIEWSSSNPGVATVDNSGSVTPVAGGQAQIRATSSGVTGTASVTVTVDSDPDGGDGGGDPDPSIATVQASHASYNFTALGKTQQFSATALDGNGDPVAGTTFSWSSSKTDVASVDASGKVSAKAVGIASIIVCASACSAADTIAVSVEQIATSVSASPTSVSLTVGETQQLGAVVKDDGGYEIPDADVKWTTSNASVATISSAGLVTALSQGTATFKATSGTAIVQVSGSMQGADDGTGGEDLPTGDAFFVEGFDSGDLSNTMGGFSWSSPNRTSVVDWFSRDPGGHSLRFRYPGGEPGTDSHAEQRFAIGRNLSEYWLEFWIYLPDGLEDEEGLFPEGFSSAKFQIRSGDGPSNMKFLRLWDGSYSADNKHGASIWQSASGEPNARWGFESTRSSGSMGLITMNPRTDPFLHESTGPVRHGEWAQLRLHVKFSSNADDTADGGADGVVEFWVNGQLVASRYDQPLHGDIAGNGYNSWASVGYFMGWANSGFDAETYVFIDDIAFHDSNPGW